MFRVFSIVALALSFAGTASAQCPNGQCSGRPSISLFGPRTFAIAPTYAPTVVLSAPSPASGIPAGASGDVPMTAYYAPPYALTPARQFVFAPPFSLIGRPHVGLFGFSGRRWR